MTPNQFFETEEDEKLYLEAEQECKQHELEVKDEHSFLSTLKDVVKSYFSRSASKS